MQRAAISIPSNIAEGSGRSTKKDFRLFLNHARGSIYELMTQLEISYDLKYITKEQFEYIENKITILTKRINSFIRKLSE